MLRTMLIAAAALVALGSASPAFAGKPKNGTAENGTVAGTPATVQGITLPNAITLRG